MRNYVLMFWAEVYFSFDEVGFDRRLYVAADEEDLRAVAQTYLEFLQNNFNPGFFIWKWFDYEGNEVAGPQQYYLELNKPNLVALFGHSGSQYGGGVADQIWGSTEFGLQTTRTSPRDSWSHGH
jgi:hypothetical protein